MIQKLMPDELHDTIFHINLKRLYEKGYRNILVDVDNTITPWNSDIISDQLRQWVEGVVKMGFVICLFSNSHSRRTKRLAESLGVCAAPCGGKPFMTAFRKAISSIEGTPETTVMIGDQVFTDILGGNRMKLYTILVNPVSTTEFFGTKINRWLERILIDRR